MSAKELNQFQAKVIANLPEDVYSHCLWLLSHRKFSAWVESLIIRAYREGRISDEDSSSSDESLKEIMNQQFGHVFESLENIQITQSKQDQRLRVLEEDRATVSESLVHTVSAIRALTDSIGRNGVQVNPAPNFAYPQSLYPPYGMFPQPFQGAQGMQQIPQQNHGVPQNVPGVPSNGYNQSPQVPWNGPQGYQEVPNQPVGINQGYQQGYQSPQVSPEINQQVRVPETNYQSQKPAPITSENWQEHELPPVRSTQSSGTGNIGSQTNLSKAASDRLAALDDL